MQTINISRLRQDQPIREEAIASVQGQVYLEVAGVRITVLERTGRVDVSASPTGTDGHYALLVEEVAGQSTQCRLSVRAVAAIGAVEPDQVATIGGMSRDFTPDELRELDATIAKKNA